MACQVFTFHWKSASSGGTRAEPEPLRPADLTPTALADLLHRAFEADLGDVEDPLGPEQRAQRADDLGCHPEAGNAAWDAWLPLPEEESIEPSDAKDWLDVEFIEPCPESAEAPPPLLTGHV